MKNYGALVFVLASACGAQDELSIAKVGATQDALVWAEQSVAPFPADSPDVANGGFSNRSTGDFGASSNSPGIGETAAEGWLESSFTLPAFVRSATFVADVRIALGQVNVGGPFLGWGSAGAHLTLSVTGGDGTVLCSQQVVLSDQQGFALQTIGASNQRLSCSTAGTGGNVRVRATLRAWTSAFGLAVADANISGRLNALRVTKDSREEDAGDVVVTNIPSARNAKVDDWFCPAGERCDVGEDLTRGDFGGSAPALIAYLDSGDAWTGGLSLFPYLIVDRGLRGSDVCHSNETCLLGDIDGDRRDDVVAFSSTGVATSQMLSTRQFAARRATPVVVQLPRFPTGFIRSNLCAARACALADVNGDGLADVVAFNRVGNSNSPPIVSLNAGGGAFATVSGFTVTTPDVILCAHRACVFGDVNGDGADDLVDFGAADGVRVAFASGAGFLPSALVATGFCAASDDCQLGDINGDGRADLVALTHDSGGRARIAQFRGGTVFDAPFVRNTVCTAERVCKVRRGDVFAFVR